MPPPDTPRSLVWIASYPKSGNTWIRAFLANYLLDGEPPLPLEALGRISHGDVPRGPYARIAGRDPATLDAAGLMVARERYLHQIAATGETVFVKTHHPVASLAGRSFIPRTLTRAAILVVRNPLDLVVSYADHFALALPAAAAAIAHRRNTVPLTPRTVPQFLGSWSDSVASWANCPDFPVETLRYEDLLARPRESFARMLAAIGAPVDEALVARAAEASAFAALSRLEDETGFDEKGTAQARFFREGRAGQWRDRLGAELAARIRRDHGHAMQRFGYF